MQKLKKQQEALKKRKVQEKREKGWVGGSTTKRETTPTGSFVDEQGSDTIMIDTTRRGRQSGKPTIESFDFESLD